MLLGNSRPQKHAQDHAKKQRREHQKADSNCAHGRTYQALTLRGYGAATADDPSLFIIGGGFHLPVRASDFGAYSRIHKLNAPFGAGSQLASLSLPGLSCWK